MSWPQQFIDKFRGSNGIATWSKNKDAFLPDGLPKHICSFPEKYRLETFQFFGCPFAHGHYFLCTLIPHTGFHDFRILWIMELSWKVSNNYDLPERSIPFCFDKDLISINSSFIFSAQCRCKKKTLKLLLCVFQWQHMYSWLANHHWQDLKPQHWNSKIPPTGRSIKKVVHGPSCDQAVLLPFC